MNDAMLKSRQKEITDCIKSRGFKLKEFKFVAVNNTHFELKWEDSNYFFLTNENGYKISPGLKGTMTGTANVGGWIPNLGVLEKWLDIIVKEKEIGDPWAESDEDYHFYQGINEEHHDGEARFSEAETKNIAFCLAEIKQHILSNAEITQQQFNTITSDFKRLEENTNKISAKDWYLLFIGQLLSWVAGGFLTPDQPKALFHKVAESVAGGMKTMFNILG